MVWGHRCSSRRNIHLCSDSQASDVHRGMGSREPRQHPWQGALPVPHTNTRLHLEWLSMSWSVTIHLREKYDTSSLINPNPLLDPYQVAMVPGAGCKGFPLCLFSSPFSFSVSNPDSTVFVPSVHLASCQRSSFLRLPAPSIAFSSNPHPFPIPFLDPPLSVYGLHHDW